MANSAVKFAHRVTKSKDRDVEWSGRQAEPAVKAIKEPVRRLLSGYIVHRPFAMKRINAVDYSASSKRRCLNDATIRRHASIGMILSCEITLKQLILDNKSCKLIYVF